jgi:hypothetical protein
MASEMEGKFIGPMPPSEFLEAYLPTRRRKKWSQKIKSRFIAVKDQKSERAVYDLWCVTEKHSDSQSRLMSMVARLARYSHFAPLSKSSTPTISAI